jgi:uncharacterized membrane protein YsdA (DUF1294 family)
MNKKRKMKSNKKGEGSLLPEETLKILVAILCIVILAGLVILIYFALTGNEDKQKAQGNIDRIANETNRINAGSANVPSFPVLNPSGWTIFSFVGIDKKPNSCAGASCLCICETLTIGIYNVDERQAQRCDDKGSCTVIINLKKNNNIKIEKGGIFISIKKIDGLIEINKNGP